MLVTLDSLESVVMGLKAHDRLSLDTETYGLGIKDKLFSIQIATATDEYYFNFHDYPVSDMFVPTLPRKTIQVLRDNLFHDDMKMWFIHNAKFDLKKLRLDNCTLSGRIWCTELSEHFVRNNFVSYSLEACLERIGMKKDDAVKAWLDDPKNNGYTMSRVPGKKNRKKIYHFDRVPFDLMYKYGCMDVRGCYDLGIQQINQVNNCAALNNCDNLLRTVADMEQNGMMIDVEYCKRALAYEEQQAELERIKLETMAGRPFKNGPKWLAETLTQKGVEYGKSIKGNPLFNKDALRSMDNDVTNSILEMRSHEKKSQAFFSSYIHMADNLGILHPDYRIEGTDTGRFSCADPNLQQVPKEESGQFSVRGAFKPRPGYIYVMMDYDQMEYRLLADYAGEMGMIEAIKGGLDPHTFVANTLGITRKLAKTVNFALLYGVGLSKLAVMLGVSVEEATKIRNDYFSKLPRIKWLINEINKRYKQNKFIYNKFGRRYFLDRESDSYKLPNYLIQGTGADIVKHAMVKIARNVLEGMRSMLVAQVHDELLFEIHESELHIIPDIRKIMETVYEPHNGMNLTCGVEWSLVSWANSDKREGIPTTQEIKEWKQSLQLDKKNVPQQDTESISTNCISI